MTDKKKTNAKKDVKKTVTKKANAVKKTVSKKVDKVKEVVAPKKTTKDKIVEFMSTNLFLACIIITILMLVLTCKLCDSVPLAFQLGWSTFYLIYGLKDMFGK